jgi:hypothetical protein
VVMVPASQGNNPLQSLAVDVDMCFTASLDRFPLTMVRRVNTDSMCWVVVVIAVTSEGPFFQLTVAILFRLCSFPLVTKSFFTCIDSCFSFIDRLIYGKNFNSTKGSFNAFCWRTFWLYTSGHKYWLHRTAEVDDRLPFNLLLVNHRFRFSYLLFGCAKIDNHLFLFDGMQHIVVRITILHRTDKNPDSFFDDRFWCLCR